MGKDVEMHMKRDCFIQLDDGMELFVEYYDSTKEYVKDLAVGSAAGALSGLTFGALADGEVGKGAALGTAVGAGAGLVKSIWDKGADVEIPVNASVDVMFTQPITVTASSY